MTELQGSTPFRRLVEARMAILFAVAVGTLLPEDASAGGDFAVTWDETASGEPLDISKYRLVFEEGFDAKQLTGPKVFAPVHAPFGAGTFDGPTGDAYQVEDGSLTLNAYKRNGRWRSGSVQTANPSQSRGLEPFSDGKGFACGDCYFETRLKFPKGVVPGPWGGFWLLSPEAASGHVEVDVIEWYGGDPKGHHQTVHVWPKKARHAYRSNYIGMQSLTDGEWHTYEVKVGGDTVRIFMDGKEISRVAVPEEFDTAYYALVSLAVFPKQADVADPFSIEVDYIRAYAP